MFKISFLVFLVFFTAILVYLSNRYAIKLIGRNSHPIGGLFFLKLFLTSAIGIVLVIGEYYDNNYNMIEDINDDSLIIVTVAFFYSYLLFFILTIFTKKIDLKKYHKLNIDVNIKFIYSILFFMFIYNIYIYIMAGGNLPILLLLSGEGSTAVNTLKALFLTDQLAIRIPYIDLLVKLIFPFSSIYILNIIYTNSDIKYLKILFGISIILNLFYLTHDGQKAPFFILLIMLGFLYTYHKGINKKIILLSFIALIGLQQLYVASFSITEKSSSIMKNPFFQRLFIGQSRGMYYMDDWIEPDIAYMKHAIPLIRKFDDRHTQRADAKLMIMKYGETDVHVNMNTYYLGEAYSMLGNIGYIIAPIIVTISLFIYLLIFNRLYRKDYIFFLPVSIVFFFSIPITQAFYPFIFQKEAIIQFLMIGVLYIIYKTTKKITIGKIK